MKIAVLIFGALWALGASAKAPPSPSSVKELSREAEQLLDRAALELDPAKADALRKQACGKWEEAYNKGKRPETQLELGLCYGTRKDFAAAEVAFRAFLAVAPSNHPDRATAEQSLAYAQEAQRAQAAQTPPALVFKDPVPVEIKETHPWRPFVIAGGALTGASLVAVVLVRGVLSAQDPGIPEGKGGTAVLQP